MDAELKERANRLCYALIDVGQHEDGALIQALIAALEAAERERDAEKARVGVWVEKASEYDVARQRAEKQAAASGGDLDLIQALARRGGEGGGE
jgi:lipoate-protein ligase B